MKRIYLIAILALLAALPAGAQETVPDDAAQAEALPVERRESDAAKPEGATPDQPRSMSGMSILGNEEAPKALVIIPWKSSELGDEIGMPEHLDDKATPVDREVFLRELRFYEIRQGVDE